MNPINKKLENLLSFPLSEGKKQALSAGSRIRAGKHLGRGKLASLHIKIPHGRLTTGQLLKAIEFADLHSFAWLRLDFETYSGNWDYGDHDSQAVLIGIHNSPFAGIDPGEAFDSSPFARALGEYFNSLSPTRDSGPVFAIGFVASEQDAPFPFDLGFMPVIKGQKRGFSLLIGDGLASSSVTVLDFFPAKRLTALSKAVLKVFGRYDRENPAIRLKALVEGIGIEEFLGLVEAEARKFPTLKLLPEGAETFPGLPQPQNAPFRNIRKEKFQLWRDKNTVKQKQAPYFAVKIPLQAGNLRKETAFVLASVIERLAADDIRLSPQGNLWLRFVKGHNLEELFATLDIIGLAELEVI